MIKLQKSSKIKMSKNNYLYKLLNSKIKFEIMFKHFSDLKKGLIMLIDQKNYLQNSIKTQCSHLADYRSIRDVLLDLRE